MKSAKSPLPAVPTPLPDASAQAPLWEYHLLGHGPEERERLKELLAEVQRR